MNGMSERAEIKKMATGKTRTGRRERGSRGEETERERVWDGAEKVDAGPELAQTQ